MLEPAEEQAFQDLVARFHTDDQPRPWARMIAILLWATAPLWIVFGGWSGVLAALAAIIYGAVLTSKNPRNDRPDLARDATKRPGAEI